jgi:hypothetical protein
MIRILAVGILILTIIILASNVSTILGATRKYTDGYLNGREQALIDFHHHNQFNMACDPNGNYTNKGKHSHLYCRGWIDGYTAKWQKLVPTGPGHSTIASPDDTSSQTTYSWFAPIVLILIAAFIIVWTKYKLKHRVRKNRKRHCFPESIKERTLNKQHHKCLKCNKLLNVVDFDHKDNDRSNNRESNCVALCPNCHAIKTRS